MRIALERGLSDSEVVLKTLRRNISPYLYESRTEKADGGIAMTVGLGIQEPIVDHGERGLTVHFTRLEDVATYETHMAKGRMFVEGPSRTDVNQRANDKYGAIISRSHRALLPILYRKLVRIPEVSISMSPLRKILIFLEETGHVSAKAIRRPGQSTSRVEMYFSLLRDLGYIQSDNGGYVPGSGFSDLKSIDVGPPDLYEHILGDVIRRRSKYLQEVLHWTMMVPFLRWSNTYYLPAYQAGRLLRSDRVELVQNYTRYYGSKRREAETISQLQRTVDVGALRRETPFYLGDQGILEDYFRKADEQRVLVES